jgi:hypothetical protein
MAGPYEKYTSGGGGCGSVIVWIIVIGIILYVLSKL